ncbi:MULTISPECIES: helix-turn-helix domain-containing protein [unclassified Ensifer]|uniref:helix-turn-helix domain-containing protein n=1 Tax=unclassified Ensifer TaxID=2633371 RepID=UPI0008133E56|nr:MULTISPECIES: helix-turn-helix domain-containing protein [unclassified Ensifer]OCP02826.1 AraC family transcriptional regulator [Ensifer sp. LC14]OCP13727.1 AraC family transcriptional regulator [Ensifer sp. LC13]OCP14385.1 AraC family transcriptional regulator [Ensifer sp. LC11]OCP29091.1 AraC family transcriptional regulator [Ensifer sp. LC499]
MKKTVPTYELYGEKTGERPDFWLHCETIPSRSSLYHWEIGLHRHESFFQILYIAGGSGDAVFAGQVHAIEPPAVITVPPALSHGFRFSRDIDGFVFTILASHLKVSPGQKSRLGAWLAAPHLTRLDGSEDASYVAATLTRLAVEWGANRSNRTDLLDAYLTSVLTLTARLGETGKDQVDAADSENEQRVQRFQALLQQHHRAHWAAAAYARELGLSPTHLNRILRAVTGQSTQEMIARKLVGEARRELLFTRASVQEISFRLGFADPAYFSRFFLRQTGMTPRAWRLAERTRLGA